MQFDRQKSPSANLKNHRRAGKFKILSKLICQEFLIGRVQFVLIMTEKDKDRWPDPLLNQVFNFKQRAIKTFWWIVLGKFPPELVQKASLNFLGSSLINLFRQIEYFDNPLTHKSRNKNERRIINKM